MAKLKRFPKSIHESLAFILVLVLWLVYTVLQTLFVMGYASEGWSALLGFVPGLLGVGVLLFSGRSRADCYLQIRGLSWAGLAVLAAVFVFALSAVLPFGVWQGWSWLAATSPIASASFPVILR